MSEPIEWIIEPWHVTGFVVHDGNPIMLWRNWLHPNGTTAPVGAFFDTREEVDAAIEKHANPV
jgi:hypothetical protein